MLTGSKSESSRSSFLELILFLLLTLVLIFSALREMTWLLILDAFFFLHDLRIALICILSVRIILKVIVIIMIPIIPQPTKIREEFLPIDLAVESGHCLRKRDNRLKRKSKVASLIIARILSYFSIKGRARTSHSKS